MTTTHSFSTDRRTLLGGLAAGAAASLLPRFVQAQTAAPIKLGFQLHRTGIGAIYGRWYERTATAALAVLNEAGGINGRPVEIVFEDDGTDPKRGAEVVEKLVSQASCDMVFGALFSNVVVASAPRAAELRVPYLVCSEGHHVASGTLNRWTLQPGITDVKSQVRAMAPWVAANLGKKVTMLYADYSFGHDHRDFFSQAITEQGGEIVGLVGIPPTETSFTRYFARIPRDTEVLYHVMVGPAVLTFVKELGEFYGSGARPEIFGFIDSLEGVSIDSPGLGFLEGTHFWEGQPRYLQPGAGEQEAFYRGAVGVDDSGAAIVDPQDVSTYSHMFSAWETLFAIKTVAEASGYRGPEDRQTFVEAMEVMGEMKLSREHPQGDKIFDGKLHQAFGIQHISKVAGGRMDVVHTTSIEDGLYPSDVNYTKMAF